MDGVAEEQTRPQLLWRIDTQGASLSSRRGNQDGGPLLVREAPPLPRLRAYSAVRQRQDAWALLGFCLDTHPMTLHAEELRRFRLVHSTQLSQYVGRRVLMAGMFTTGKPVHTAAHEPMQFATFDDGHGLIETVLFPRVYRERSHVLFDQGPFIFRGTVEESFGAITVTITHLERLERMVARMTANGER